MKSKLKVKASAGSPQDSDPESFWGNGQLRRIVSQRYAPGHVWGWGPTMRLKAEYYTPDDFYESCLDHFVRPGETWLDVGGGDSILPDNPEFAAVLVRRCNRVVAVDPSPNVLDNRFAHERAQCLLEDYSGDRTFDLATMRMVLEHVVRPREFVDQLARLVRPGGKAIVFTVDSRAILTLISANTPMWVHHALKKVVWNTRQEDTFPVAYRMNSRSRLKEFFMGSGFRETAFRRLDDCRTLAKWKLTHAAELSLWKALRSLGLGYPEACLLGVYERME